MAGASAMEKIPKPVCCVMPKVICMEPLRWAEEQRLVLSAAVWFSNFPRRRVHKADFKRLSPHRLAIRRGFRSTLQRTAQHEVSRRSARLESLAYREVSRNSTDFVSSTFV